MSQERHRREHVGRYELAIHQTIDRFEIPLLQKLWNKWGHDTLPSGKQRGWLVCGPASVALSRILNWETGIPIRPNPPGEHIKFIDLLYDNNGEIMDHGALLYDNDKGNTTLIDVVRKFLWGGQQKIEKGAIHIATYPTKDIDRILREQYHLYPYDINDQRLRRHMEPYVSDMTKLSAHLDDFYQAYYDSRVTDPQPFRGNSGEMRSDHRYGTPLTEIITSLIPDWNGIK